MSDDLISSGVTLRNRLFVVLSFAAFPLSSTIPCKKAAVISFPQPTQRDLRQRRRRQIQILTAAMPHNSELAKWRKNETGFAPSFSTM